MKKAARARAEAFGWSAYRRQVSAAVSRLVG
jgi:hypothetical protein